MMASVGPLFEGKEANNPNDVAQAYVDLINMPQGTRPLRTPIGKDSACVNELNALSVSAQRQMMGFYGLEEYLAK